MRGTLKHRRSAKEMKRDREIILLIWLNMNQQRMPRSGCKEVRTLWKTA